MFYIKILINALFLTAQIYVSAKYQYKRSIIITILYIIYVILVFPYVTYSSIYIYLILMNCLFSWAAYYQRDRLYMSKKSRTEFE